MLKITNFQTKEDSICVFAYNYLTTMQQLFKIYANQLSFGD